MAERGGFEPPMPFPARRISSAVHSTTLPPLRISGWREQRDRLIAIAAQTCKGQESTKRGHCLDFKPLLQYPAALIKQGKHNLSSFLVV